jgi:hypothetical protein
MKYYALGTKGWVEIRSARKAPTLETSKAVIPYTRRVLDYTSYYNTGRMTTKEMPLKLKMDESIFKGGRVVASIRSREFASVTKVAIRKNGILELPADKVDLLKEKGYIK